MKKHPRILLLLAAALVVFAMLPVQATSATSYEKAFDKLTFAKALKYDKAPPTNGGKVQSAAQINKTLKSIGYFKQAPGNGKVLCNKSISFWKEEGTIDSVNKNSKWSRLSGKSYDYYEELTYLNKWGGDIPTWCWLENRGGGDYNWYNWAKKSTTGEYNIDTDPWWSPPSKKKPKETTGPWIYKKYKDAKVLGQPCFVYSWQGYYDDTYTYYTYVSRKTGIVLKTVSYYSTGDYWTEIHFVYERVAKAPGNFKLPKSITWNKFEPNYGGDWE